MAEWVLGQRCASVGELSLGLGIILKVTNRNIQVHFPATDTQRTYSNDSVPLRRVTFDAGDRVRDNSGKAFIVQEVKEQNGLFFYLGEHDLIPETELDHTIVYSRPEQKLLAGYINKPESFDLRCQTWKMKNRALDSPARGFTGARIELIPHQLYIADEVSRRRFPRVLLSDEVGLGKTIEAGLIFHRLWITGEVKRVLCLVPGPLVTQWLTEFYRKFNVLFSIMSEEHAEELAKVHAELNPYMCHQCVLQDIDQLVRDEELSQQVIEADWDLVIVDEAHHLYWSEEQTSPAYQLVEALSFRCGGLLLLTATPRQLGLQSHFGRLKLLDPERFDSWERFQAETKTYTRLADITERVLAGKSKGVAAQVGELFPEDGDLLALAPGDDTGDPARDQQFIRALIDRHGTGRMVFRNHRKVLSGFPQRNLHAAPLSNNAAYEAFTQQVAEILKDDWIGQSMLAGAPAFSPADFPGRAPTTKKMLDKAWRDDPRLAWLLSLLREHPNRKFLLICSRKAVVLALQEWLARAPDIEVATFHEELSLLERDRQAAYFAKNDGARVLLCSEIGSEGRNFQFANQLVLFDLPINPALLEQRIGRLDRIGQHEDIDIYVPFAEHSALANLFAWYDRGLDAFRHHLLEGDYIYEHLKTRIFTIFETTGQPALIEPFIEESRQFVVELKTIVEKGRDRLLELNSFEPERAAALVTSIEEVEDDFELKYYMDAVFENFGVIVEDQDRLSSQIIMPSPQMYVSSFPGLPEDGLEITYERAAAIAREELTFLSYDHPMVNGVFDMLLSMEKGTTSFALWREAPEAGLLIDCNFILECHGGEEARLDRYLPPMPIRIAVDNNKRSRPDLREAMEQVTLERGPKSKLFKQREALTQIVESLLVVAEEEAQNISRNLLAEAEKRIMNGLKEEYDRLKALIDVNPNVRQEELDDIEEMLHDALDYLEASKTRLDAIRLVMMLPS